MTSVQTISPPLGVSNPPFGAAASCAASGNAVGDGC